MRRIALAVVFSTLFPIHAARANDAVASDDKAKDPIVSGTPKDAAAPDPAKETDTLVPAKRPPQPSGSESLAGVAVLRSLHVGLVVSQAYDVYSTTQALRRGAVEVNPLLQNTVASRAAFIGLKVAITAGPIYEAERLWRNHHRFGAIALIAAANAIMMGVAVHNTEIMNHAVRVR